MLYMDTWDVEIASLGVAVFLVSVAVLANFFFSRYRVLRPKDKYHRATAGHPSAHPV